MLGDEPPVEGVAGRIVESHGAVVPHRHDDPRVRLTPAWSETVDCDARPDNPTHGETSRKLATAPDSKLDEAETPLGVRPSLSPLHCTIGADGHTSGEASRKLATAPGRYPDEAETPLGVRPSPSPFSR